MAFIRLLVEKGANVNARTLKDPELQLPWNQTPLHYAVYYDNDQNAAALLDLGADINAVDSDGRTALYRALTGLRPKCAALLRKRGATESKVNPKINEAIAAADFGADLSKLQALLKEDPSLARAADPDTLITPLHLAAKEGSLEGIKILLAGEADVNARNKNGLTPLHVAFEAGRYIEETLTLLVKGGSDVRMPYKTGLNSWRTTPLLRLFDLAKMHSADPRKYEELVRLFLEHGADVNVGVDKDTPMKRAIELNNPRILALMVEHGAEVNASGRGGDTALIAAARNLDMAGMAILLDHGAFIDAKDEHGRTALHCAARCDRGWDRGRLLNEIAADDDGARLQAVQFLVARGANLNFHDKYGWTPLDFAEYTQCAPVSVWLKTQKAEQSNFSPDALEYYRSVEKRDYTAVDRILTAHPELVKVWDSAEWPPVLRANYYMNVPLLKTLLSHGADPDLQAESKKGTFDVKGVTPLMIAIEQNNIEAVKVLVEFHADVNKPDRLGRRPLNFAPVNKFPEIAEFLAAHGAKRSAPADHIRPPKIPDAVKPPRPPSVDFDSPKSDTKIGPF